ncbi:putative 3-hydroxybutyryl-CoA dehydrogenase [Clostridium sp. MSTE9]|uniref:3-hydroxyacyl-CoA dehydrogenase family protein n=1 Tax=Clostridium sp. (strain MSTE9) TaxID=1105031 RepID=UPI00026F2394|nr:3-hydroxyacyl-CoA dehydrogenase family protein [Clostridium sp. MSTE9]EJF42555.1 putative 3-hydroxybutyryl-CoA dehydrogenase [Clostridium sp. MSTE9]
MQTEQIQKVVMAGAGTMGTSMAQIFAAHGYDTVLYNHREATLQKARRMVELNQEALVLSGELSQAESDAVKARIQLTSDESCFQDCDVVVESIVENMQAKHQLWQKISDLAREGAILTTNTSGLSITEIAKAVQRPERFCGMHWFNPPHLVPLVEVIKGEKTGDQTARVVAELAERIGKKAVTVKKDAKGFIGNRLQTAILREALHIVQSGIADAEDVDKAVKYGIGFRYACLGPLETADFGGLDIFYHVAEYLVPDLYSSQEVPALLREKFEKGELGVKTGKGFYDYSGDKGEQAIRERDEKFIRLYHALYQK